MTDTEPKTATWILNPRTNRRLKFGSKSYYKFLEEEKVLLAAEKTRLEAEKVANEQEAPPLPIKNALARELVDIVGDNKPKFVDLTKKQTDKLLRKLLIEKLTVKAKKPKAKKKKYRRIVTPEPSSSESSSDSSDSESSDSP
jgi:hypothetical protein